MELIYRTIDGKEFDNEADASYHEHIILNEKVQMFDPQGNPTGDPNYAMAIFLCGEDAADAFINISKKADVDTNGIRSGDEGVYVWDSLDAEYKYIEIESLRAVHSALGAAIKARWAD
jgi:hypothetical protein